MSDSQPHGARPGQKLERSGTEPDHCLPRRGFCQRILRHHTPRKQPNLASSPPVEPGEGPRDGDCRGRFSRYDGSPRYFGLNSFCLLAGGSMRHGRAFIPRSLQHWRRALHLALLILAIAAAATCLSGHRTPPAAAQLIPLGNGDVNADRAIDIGDPIYLLTYLFNAGPPPEPIQNPPRTDSVALGCATRRGSRPATSASLPRGWPGRSTSPISYFGRRSTASSPPTFAGRSKPCNPWPSRRA